MAGIEFDPVRKQVLAEWERLQSTDPQAYFILANEGPLCPVHAVSLEPSHRDSPFTQLNIYLAWVTFQR